MLIKADTYTVRPLHPGMIYQMQIYTDTDKSIITIDLSDIESPADVLLLEIPNNNYATNWAQRPEAVYTPNSFHYYVLPGTGKQLCIPAFAGTWSEDRYAGPYALSISQICEYPSTGEHYNNWFFRAEDSTKNVFGYKRHPQSII